MEQLHLGAMFGSGVQHATNIAAVESAGGLLALPPGG